MRKAITALAALLLAVTSAQGGYILSLESGGASAVPLPSGGCYLVDLMIASDGLPSATFGETTFLGAQTVLGPLPDGWSVSNLVYNTVDFDSAQIVPGSSLAGLLGIAADTAVAGDLGYSTKKRLLSFTMVATDAGMLRLDDTLTSVVDSQFNTVYVGPGDVAMTGLYVGGEPPEPATALLLMAAVPLLRRRRA